MRTSNVATAVTFIIATALSQNSPARDKTGQAADDKKDSTPNTRPASWEGTGIRVQFNIPRQSLVDALAVWSRQSGLQVLSRDTHDTADLTAPSVAGKLFPAEALERMLVSTGLTYEFVNDRTVRIAPVQAATTAVEPHRTSLRLAQLDPAPSGMNGNRSAAAASSSADTSSAAPQGEPEPAQKEQALEEVVVSGFYFRQEVEISSKSLLSIRETPQAISVITLDSLKARQVTGLGQALEAAASVSQSSEPGPFAGRSATGFTTFQIRGVELPFYYGVYEDGFLFPQIAGTLDLAPYERLEVVKGPNSALYGQGAAGGFINLVRKKPQRDTAVNLEANLGSFDYYRVDADVTGALSGSGRVLGRMAIGYEDAGAFVDFAKSKRVVIAPNLQFILSDRTKLSLQGTYQDDRFIPHYGTPLQRTGENFTAPDVRRSLYFGTPNGDLSDNRRKLQAVALKMDHQINDQWLADLRLSTYSAEQSLATERYAYFLDQSGNTSMYRSSFDNKGDVWSAELRLNGRLDLFGRKANVTVGMEANEFDYHRLSESSGLGGANIYDENFDDVPSGGTGVPYTSKSNFVGKGVYGQLYFRPVDRLAVLLGGRYSQTDTQYYSEYFGFVTERDSSDKRFVGRAGLTYDLTQQIALYGLYAESFIPVTFAIGSDGNPLAPETGRIGEVGVKTEWLDRRLGINAAIFRIERDKVPISDPDNLPTEFFQISGGLQRSEGFELEINGEPLPGWNLSFGGTLLDSKFVERDDPNFGNTSRGVADWQFSFFTSYQLQTGIAKGLGFSAGMFATDKRPVTANERGTIDGFERMDLGLFYERNKDFKIALQVRNVFDEKYIESLERPNALNHFGSPRAVMVTVRKKF